jgi:hypothetical protein
MSMKLVLRGRNPLEIDQSIVGLVEVLMVGLVTCRRNSLKRGQHKSMDQMMLAMPTWFAQRHEVVPILLDPRWPNLSFDSLERVWPTSKWRQSFNRANAAQI